MLKVHLFLPAMLVQGLLCATAQAADWSITPLKRGGIYAAGENAGWTVKPEASAAGNPYRFELRYTNLGDRDDHGGTELETAGQTILVKDSRPGMVFLAINGRSGPPQVAGLAVSPRQIAPSIPAPRDFDRFWNKKIRQAQKVPLAAELKSGTSAQPGVEYFTLRMNHSDGGYIHGQLAKPAHDGKFPALVIFQWAGRPYPLQQQWVTERAAQGWLVLNIEPHDVLPDQPQAYYDALPDELKNYQTIGRDDRNRNYFLRMYLGDYRAVNYLASRPDWNGETLVAMGTSMGGQQSICTAALNSRVTALIAHVPSGADALGPLHGRASGYPNWPADNKAVQRTAPYFDTVNCASRVKVPALISMGFLDTVAPPMGIWAMFNQLRGPKEVAPLVDAAHNNQSTAEQQAAYTRRAEAWLEQLRNGRPPLPPMSRAEPRTDANFQKAHEQLLVKKTQGRIDVYFIGDSITRRWGTSDAQYSALLANWNQNFHGWNAGDFGWGGDRIQNILWRLDNGELTDVNPKVIVIMAGTNNLSALPAAGNEPELAAEIAAGIHAIVQRAKTLAPRATIVLMGIAPRNDNMAYMPVITQTNALLAKLANGRSIRFLNLNDKLADATGKLLPGMTDRDMLHLALPAYQIWADALRPVLTSLLGPPASTDSAPPPSKDVTTPRN
ncbi:MAG: acetylxylan esterase [Steroidobacteraceae bacterium]